MKYNIRNLPLIVMRKYNVGCEIEYITPTELGQRQFEECHTNTLQTALQDGDYFTLAEVQQSENSDGDIGYEDEPQPSQQPVEDENVPPPCLGPGHVRLSIRIRHHKGLIENIIDVEEVIPYLPFNFDRQVTSNRNVSPRHRVGLLLKEIEETDALSKWEMFLEALRLSNYTYLLEKITGENTDDYSILEAILRKTSPLIRERVKVSDIIHHLYQKGVLNMQDMERIMAEDKNHGNKSACFVMINLIPRRLPDWYERLKEVFQNTDMADVVEVMKNYEMEAAMQISRVNEVSIDKNIAVKSNANDGSCSKDYEKFLINETNPEEARLWKVRQELRNIVHNMKDKKSNTERANRLVSDIRNITLEVLEVNGCELCCAVRDTQPCTDTPNRVQHREQQTAPQAHTNNTSQLNNQYIHDALKGIGEIKEQLARTEQSVSDLTESVRNQSISFNIESFPTCSKYLSSDSAYFGSSLSAPDHPSCSYSSIITHL